MAQKEREIFSCLVGRKGAEENAVLYTVNM